MVPAGPEARCRDVLGLNVWKGIRKQGRFKADCVLAICPAECLDGLDALRLALAHPHVLPSGFASTCVIQAEPFPPEMTNHATPKGCKIVCL